MFPERRRTATEHEIPDLLKIIEISSIKKNEAKSPAENCRSSSEQVVPSSPYIL